MKRIDLSVPKAVLSLVEYEKGLRLVAKGSNLWGAGEHFDCVQFVGKCRVNKVEEVFTHQGEHTYLPQPLFLSDQFGLLIKTDCVFSLHSFANGNELTIDIEGSFCEDDTLVFADGVPRDSLKQLLTFLNGTILPPSWVFGQWASANRWKCEEDVYEAVQEAKKNGITISALVVEAWSDESTFYRFNEEEGRYSDVKALVSYLKEEGIRLLLWQIPVFKALEEGRSDFLHEQDLAEIVEKDLMVKTSNGTAYRIPEGQWFGGSMVPDFTNPKTVAWWFEKRKSLMALGIGGFKTDGGECIFGDDAQFFNGTSGKTMKNRFAQTYVEAYRDAIGKEMVTFSRAGYTGANRSHLYWAGDQRSEWTELRSILNAGLSASISGIFWWGFDIAGFAGPLPSKELYIRSYALSAFVPLMQWHSEPVGGQFSKILKGEDAINDRSPWNMARMKGQDILLITRLYSQIRENLRWYLEREAEYSSKVLEPMMRPLFFQYDGEYPQVYDQYLLGRSLLIAPVLEEDVCTRNILLPKGRWFDVCEQNVIPGPTHLERTYPVDKIGIFIDCEDSEFERLKEVFSVLVE